MNEPVHSHDPKIKAALDVLEGKVEQLLEQHLGGDGFWVAFNAEADVILETADAHDADYARGRIDCMLKNAGMIPGEDEDEPCD